MKSLHSIIPAFTFAFDCICIVLAGYMTWKQVNTYLQNEDFSEIYFQRFTDGTAYNYPTYTICLEDYEKYCSGLEWRWGLSGEKLSFQYWDTYDGQPNNIENDHCVTMGYKDVNQRLINWNCGEKGGNYNRMTFKPVCQKNAY